MGIDDVGKLNKLLTLNQVGMPVLMETWQRAAGIDPALWNVNLHGTTGTVARSEAEEPYQKVILTGPANDDAARLYTTAKWQLAPDTWGLNTFQKALLMEWECKFATVASILTTHFFMGFAAGAAADRTSMNLAGFILSGADALNALTDDAGAETVSAVGAPVVTNWMKLSILAFPACIEFYVNEVMQARHTTADAEDLPDVNAYGMFYVIQEAAANGGALHVANVNIRPGVIL